MKVFVNQTKRQNNKASDKTMDWQPKRQTNKGGHGEGGMWTI